MRGAAKSAEQWSAALPARALSGRASRQVHPYSISPQAKQQAKNRFVRARTAGSMTAGASKQLGGTELNGANASSSPQAPAARKGRVPNMKVGTSMAVNVVHAYISQQRDLLKMVIRILEQQGTDQVLVDALRGLSPERRIADEVAAATGISARTINSVTSAFKKDGKLVDDRDTPWGSRPKGTFQLGRHCWARITEEARAHMYTALPVARPKWWEKKLCFTIGDDDDDDDDSCSDEDIS